jgi:hypothetical protein
LRAAHPHQFQQTRLDQAAFTGEKVSENRRNPFEQFGPAREQAKHLGIAKTILCEMISELMAGSSEAPAAIDWIRAAILPPFIG